MQSGKMSTFDALWYFDKAKPGVKRKAQYDDPQLEKDRKKAYEIKRKRQFQLSWQKDRQWLYFDGEVEKMFCSFCKEYKQNSSSVFVKGCDNLRLDPIKSHEKTDEHLFSEKRYTADHNPGSSEASVCLRQLDKAQHGQLAIKMRTAHYIAKHQKSFLDYKHICELDKMKGLDIGTSYTSDKGGALLVASIACVTRGEVTGVLQRAAFFSFTCDGSSDFTGDDVESIYVRTCIGGLIQDHFLGIGCPGSGSAVDIHQHIVTTFENLGLADTLQNKLVGFCSDGASNMQGRKAGLAAILKRSRPHLITVHCLAHRLELAFKDTIKRHNTYEKMLALLLGLYYMYRRSPKMKNGLRQSFEAHQSKFLMPTRIGGTRWLPYLSLALNNFLRGTRLSEVT